MELPEYLDLRDLQDSLDGPVPLGQEDFLESVELKDFPDHRVTDRLLPLERAEQPVFPGCPESPD